MDENNIAKTKEKRTKRNLYQINLTAYASGLITFLARDK